MKVSVLVPIYGVEKYIERCAVSLFEQTYEDIEYIFVNDCTKDNSISVLKGTLERYPNRKSQVKIIEHDCNKGLGAARNTAVGAATGEFLIHVDSDDYVDVSCVEKCVTKQLDNDADIVSVEILRMERKKNIKHQHIHELATPKDLNLAVCKHIIPNNIWGRLIRRSLYVNNNISVAEGVNMSEDLNVLPRLLYYSKRVAYVNEILYYYDCTNVSSYTSSFSEQKVCQVRTTERVLHKFFNSRDKEILSTLNKRFYIDTIDHLVNSGKESGHLHFYNETRILLDNYPFCDRARVDLSKKIALFIKNYYMFCMYVRFASYIKQILKNR